MITAGLPSFPGRISREDALCELRRLRASGGAPRALESFPAPLAVLNAQRQVIFSNPAFQDLVGAKGAEEVCGWRPGEALGCPNARRGSCGDTEACGFCGVREAIIETQTTGRTAVRECSIAAGAAGAPRERELLVEAMPFEIDGSPYVMVSLTDISHLRHRGALERIFFHDIQNTASSFRVTLELLRREDLPGERRAILVDRLSAICDALEEEIQGQRIMVSAEHGTLRAQRVLIESRGLALQVKKQAEGLRAAEGREVRIAPFSESFSFISDDVLVKRILLNMLKNALEAAPEGAAVCIGARQGADGCVVLEVHNPGFMERPVQLQVFHRFFSTKGEGRGLGTWGMKLLAEEYLGGRVEFSTDPQRGTTLSLVLPVKPDSP
jgi:hypothetical protein